MACDTNGVVGQGNKIPWSCEEDVGYFRNITLGNTLVVGRKTFDSLPQALLNKRRFIVLSRKINTSDNTKTYINSLTEFVNLYQAIEHKVEPVYMIGGGEIADLFLQNSLINEFILTVMKGFYNGDVRLNLRHFNGWDKNTMEVSEQFSRFRYIKPQANRLP
jgi:dihydrofolate reductase